VSLNADPDTGYVIPYTSDDGVTVLEFFGGTSFVAPQLNGIASLLSQKLHGRLGLFNVPLYLVAATPLAYAGPDAPLNDIKPGDNWFYQGRPGYDQGSGRHARRGQLRARAAAAGLLTITRGFRRERRTTVA